MPVVRRVVARKRGAEVWVEYDDGLVGADGSVEITGWGITGTSGRRVRVTIGLGDGSRTTSPTLVADRERAVGISPSLRPQARLVSKLGERVFEVERLDGLDMSIVTLGA